MAARQCIPLGAPVRCFADLMVTLSDNYGGGRATAAGPSNIRFTPYTVERWPGGPWPGPPTARWRGGALRPSAAGR